MEYSEDQDEITDLTKLRYVLYARKSTEDEGRQIRSIEDQIFECEQLANNLGIKVTKPYIEETKSAKEPDTRPKFKQMINDIKDGKYDAIICWHPDRLCRNMVEGGQIIHLLDTGVLKDIRFYSHQFSNDANGKMLLGMLFVFSYHYSKDLSAKVSRGVGRNISRGISGGTPKNGYKRLENGYYIPDTTNDNFNLMKKAWQLRLKGQSLVSIAEEINSLGYGRMTRPKANSNNPNPKPRKIQLTANILHHAFDDPFYYGLLIQANKTVVLNDYQEDFEPMVTEEEYLIVQELSQNKARRVRYKQRKAYYPLRGLVTCLYCDHSMTAGASTSRSGTKYLYYRCTTPGCTRTRKSIRAKTIFDFITEFLEDGLNFTEKEYERYSARFGDTTGKHLIDIRTKIHNYEGRQRIIATELKGLSSGLVKLAGQADGASMSIIAEENGNRLQELKSEQVSNKKALDALKAKLTEPEQLKLNYEDFLNLSKTAASKVKSGNVVEKDVVCQLIFLNLKIDNEKVASYSLQPTVEALLATRSYTNGRGERTRTSGLRVPNAAR